MADQRRDPNIIPELVKRIEGCAKTAETYRRIGYSGHAASAEHQAETIGRAIAKIAAGKPVADYEIRQYDG